AELYPRVVTAGTLDGLIVTATRMGDPLVARLIAGALPWVMVGRPDIDGVSYVNVDNHDGARQVAAHLCGLGRRRIGMIGGPTSTTAGLDRSNGFVDGLAECGQTLDPLLAVEGDFSEDGGYAAMRQLVGRRPDGVFVASDTMAVGALRAAADSGVRVPEDVAVVGFDGLPTSEKTSPSLTTVHQPITATGIAAVTMLNDLVSGVATHPAVEILPVDLIVRESTGATVGAQ
ncbi:MAG: substrate-binding domain-containing protein, partial [Acidimicrobiia bacterium]|nr:substrate-binding domain-containing protein [Acidimicrobiia bacterium]